MHRSGFITGVICFVVCLAGLCNCMIPDYIKPCKADDPEIAECIKHAINELRPQLKQGIPELDVPPMEPLQLDAIKLTHGIQCNVTDVEVLGSSAFEITELRANIPKNRFAFIVRLPSLKFKGHYELNSKILLLTLRGKGPIHGNFTDYSFQGILKGKRIQQNGEEYLKFDKMKLTIYPGHTTMKLENLFNGNEALGRVTNDILNDSQDAILMEVLPSLSDALSDLFTNIANKITLRFTYNELFLQN